MYKQKNHTKEVIRLTIIYTAMVLAVLTLLTFFVLRMMGYTFNLGTSQLQQTGLVQYNSYPGGAMVALDGKDVRRTRTKNTVLPGKHTFSMKLDGYEPWQKTLKITSNTVTHLSYARLIPKERKTTQVKQFAKSENAMIAPTGAFVASVGVSEQHMAVTIGDLRDTSSEKFTDYITTLTLSGYDKPATHKLTITEWDQSGKYFLVRHDYQPEGHAKLTQWLRVDRENPTLTVDVTAVTSLAIKDIHFIGSNGQELYALQESGELRTLRIGNNTISSPLLTGVTAITPYSNDRLAYTAVNGDKKQLGVWHKDWSSPFVVNTTTKDAASLVAVSRYFHEDTVALVRDSKLIIYRGELSGSTDGRKKFLAEPQTLTLDYTPSEISINNEGRFIVVRNGAMAQSYDLERQELSKVLQLNSSQPIRWLDDFHLWSVNDANVLVLQEFDGSNVHSLLPMTGSLSAALSTNQRYLYGLAQNENEIILNKMNMTNGQVGWFN